MELIRMLFWRCAAFFRRQRLEKDLDEELRAHLDLAAEENRRCGKSDEEARAAALRAFGGVTQTKERYRVQRDVPWLDSLGQDVRFGARLSLKSPGFTAVAVSALVIGIGANTAIFSIVNGVLLNPLPFPQPDRLVALSESKPDFAQGSISYPNFLDWKKENHAFSSMAVGRGWSFSLTGRGDAEQVKANFVSPGYFAVLGVHPLLGRDFAETENQPGAAPVALISEGLWRRKLNAAPDVVGQTITLDGKVFTIVGVIPATLHLNIPGFRDQDVYAPICQWGNSILMDRGAGLGFHGIARLKSGVTIEQARVDMGKVTSNLAAAFPDTDRGMGASIVPLKEEIVGDTRSFLEVLLAAVGFVLLIACVNVASLLLARSASRSREFAVRMAMGAGRRRVIRQLLTESLLLGISAGVLALPIAVWGTHAALRLLPAALPRVEEIGLDFRVLGFTTMVSLLTATLFGLAPALKSSKENPNTGLKDGGRGTSGSHHRALGTFVIVELSIALVLLSGAGLMIRSLVRLWQVDPGFNPHNVLTFALSFPPATAHASIDQTRARIRALGETFRAAPGVKAVSQAWGALPMGSEDDQLFWIDGQPRPVNEQHMSRTIDYIVDPDYLRVMGIPLKRGRFLSPTDDEHAPLVVVVDEVFARKFFPGQDPIGKRIHLVYNSDKSAEIVGIVGHAKQWGLDADESQSLRAEYYLACMQVSDGFMALIRTGTGLVIRYDGSLAAILSSIRRVNKEMSGEQVIYGEQTMDSVVTDSMATRRFAMILLGTFAGLALVLACIGIYSVMAYLVGQRTREIGIRMALGAQQGDVAWLVLRRGAGLTMTGAGIGIGATLALTPLMRSLLFDVSPFDPVILGCGGLLLAGVGLAACLIPARRAMRIEPTRALRAE